jgi:ketosteroid isomerase-like protein
MLMFDVPPPFLSRALDAYMATWEKFWSWSEKPVAFDFQDVMITAGNDVAFATATGSVRGRRPEGQAGGVGISLDHVFPKDWWSVARDA